MNPAAGGPALASAPVSQYIPLVSWALVVLTLLLISLKILSYGFVPAGDARRHIGKAFTEKSYAEIVVLRPEYTMDHSPGWEWLLRFLHQKAGWNADALVSFSVVGLMLCIFFAPLPWLRRPEAWLAALLAQTVAIPEFMIRLTQARPYLLTEAVFIAILFSWCKAEEKNPSRFKLILTAIGIALSVWVHGAWYLWVLLLPAFFLAGRRRDGIWLTVCWVAGTFLGALLTGKPVVFLKQAVDIVLLVFREHVPQWLLVGELRPSYGEFSTLILMAVVYLWRGRQSQDHPGLLRQALFWMIVVAWILGFKSDRFWSDWGVPAVLVWLTLQFEELIAHSWDAASPKSLILCGLLAAPLFLHATNDLDRRYTYGLGEPFLDAKDPAVKDWLPEAGGIFYSAHMECFYNTFYRNPTANWRYILGLEPALMPDADLRIFRDIERSHFAIRAYEPWIARMRPADRLMILTGSPPNLPQLEWYNAAGNIWLGRLPKTGPR